MRTISIYVVPKINIEHDGKIFAREIHGCEIGSPFYIFDGARHELTADEIEELRRRTGCHT